MRKSFVFWLTFICMFFCVTAASAEKAYVDGKTADRVHLRTAPSQKADSMGLFYTGTEVELDGASLKDDWVRVRIGAMNGYIMNDYLRMECPEKYMIPEAIVKPKTLNLRSAPSKDNGVEWVLQEGERLYILGQCSNGWYYVKDQNGLIGYVMPEYVQLSGAMISNINTEICKVGMSYNGDTIYSWTAPNGQSLYFAAPGEASLQFEDVNFDGHEDVIVYIIRGASNFFTEFFVWEDGRYEYVHHPDLDYGICNYQLFPEYGIVQSYINNGSAGAEHEQVLLRWEGNQLRAIRKAVSETVTETTWLEGGTAYNVHTDLSNLRVRVWDCADASSGSELIYETFISQQALENSESYSLFFNGEREALWQGIK